VSDAPYLSVVATSRNDDHGGDMLRRMQIFVNAWIEQCRRHDLPSELVLVEWNPPAGRKSLSEALRWPADPSPIHRRYRHSESLPLFQMIAKNVGIRRAHAPFVLATNVDILFSDELMSFLASRRLERGRFYRIDRSDAMSEVPLHGGVVEQLEYCRTHLLRVNQREATFAPPGAPSTPGATDETGAAFRPGGGFGLDRRATGEPYLSADTEGILMVTPPSPGTHVLRMVVEAGPNLSRERLALHVYEATGRSLARIEFRSPQRIFLPLPNTPGEELALRLRVQRCGGPPSGPQALLFRLFDWGWASPGEIRYECASPGAQAVRGPCAVPARDICEYAQGVSLHDGWGERDYTPEGQLCRRVRHGAGFSAYTPTRLPGRLLLDLEAEVGSTLDVQIVDATGCPVACGRFGGRQHIRIPIPHTGLGRRTTFTLHLAEEPGGAPTPTRHARVYGLRRVGWGQSLRELLRLIARPRVDLLHTNGCGDFTLMHRDHWLRLRGYPEWEAYSMNIDGFTCYAAHADGVQEVVLRAPMRIYHIEHGLGSGWSPEGEKRLYERISARGITWISKKQVLEQAWRMYRQGPLICNDDGWGLGREALAETFPGPRATPQQAAPAPVIPNERED
jgi:hypothetical protein